MNKNKGANPFANLRKKDNQDPKTEHIKNNLLKNVDPVLKDEKPKKPNTTKKSAPVNNGGRPKKNLNRLASGRAKSKTIYFEKAVDDKLNELAESMGINVSKYVNNIVKKELGIK